MKLLIHDIDEKIFKKVFPNIMPSITVISNNSKIHHCIGCFGCWVKTPAVCVIQDSYRDMGEILSKCDEVVIISECCYGGFSPFVKNIMDRSIPYIHPYFTTRNGEMHHKYRYKNHFSIKVYFYGEDISKEEKETAKKLVHANTINMGCISYEVDFFNNIQEMEGKLL